MVTIRDRRASVNDWDIKDTGGGTIQARSGSTGEIFNGTVAEFNVKVKTYKIETPTTGYELPSGQEFLTASGEDTVNIAAGNKDLSSILGGVAAAPNVTNVVTTNGKITSFVIGGSTYNCSYGANGLTGITRNGQTYITVNYSGANVSSITRS